LAAVLLAPQAMARTMKDTVAKLSELLRVALAIKTAGIRLQ
jgi:hypothetical protein